MSEYQEDLAYWDMVEQRDELLEQAQKWILLGRIELARMAIAKAAELDDLIEKGKVGTNER
jgi:phage shock protein A